ncbi:unnamed protein product [Microthlaspi erraticum]|uniref:DC1 domain-containing protein n=1 Tax=Microthlaspi erraticum TaxID=1685480 RepID=A0A6D2ITZ7_9BRAS|nr:unnamed protein product [Microthlaspi erraticum]
MTSKKPVNRPSVRHPSHIHPLRAFKAQDEDEIICSGCELDLTAQSFKCTKKDCDYFLHKSCFDLPCEINHKSHPDHSLTLLHSPSYSHQSYECDACGEYGSSFNYNCSECKYDVHVGCALIPETVEREDHKHPLALLYNTPRKGREDGEMYVCNVCEEDMSENLWVYYCKECDYGTHVHSCAVDDDDYEPKKGGGGESSSVASRMKSLMDAEDELVAMELESRMKRAANNAILASVRDEPKRIYYW